LIPGLLAALPLAITVYAWRPGDLLDWNSLGGIIAGFGGTILMSFIARDLGKAAEDRLCSEWGGRPTELLLMNSGVADPALRARWHSALAELFPDVLVPAAAEEAADRDNAYRRFTTLTTLVITRYRATKDKYPLVFEENCNYGFRRNMFGLRPIGFATSAIASIALGLALLIKFSSHEHVAAIAIALEAVNVIMLLIWIFWVSEATVRKGADLYAARLFETIGVPNASVPTA
jgi:hypothetical protein